MDDTRGRQYASSDAALIRGYAWHVYGDPATPAVMDRDFPFTEGEPPAPEGSFTGYPPGVLNFWKVDGVAQGLRNHVDGTPGYLVVTAKPEPPAVSDGWSAEAARLEENFQVDQRGDRTLRLVRILREAETRWGTLPECEFQVDRTKAEE